MVLTQLRARRDCLAEELLRSASEREVELIEGCMVGRLRVFRDYFGDEGEDFEYTWISKDHGIFFAVCEAISILENRLMAEAFAEAGR
jgi:hypothetical protein